MSSVADRVAAGVEWLDNNVADWRGLVEVNRFDIKNSCRCVLGQVFESQAAAYDYVDAESGFDYAVSDDEDNRDGHLLTVNEAARLGFDLPIDKAYGFEASEYWAELQNEWLRVLDGKPSSL